MLISISEFREARLRKLHIRRLQNLSSSYSKKDFTKHNFKIEGADDAVMEGDREKGKYFGLFSGMQILFISSSLIVSLCLAFILKKIFIVVFSIIPVLVVRYLNRRRVIAEQKEFISEYPAVLLATASNLKAGLSVYSALERAIQLLDENSRIKAEIRSLLEKVSRGVPKEVAVSEFAEGIDLPELRLFKRAFILVLVHGGKFSRTLERLSEVCRDRDSLVKSANVSTASMRMTANVLLAIAPLLMLILSFRTKGFWTILFENSIASGLGVVGASIIIGAFFILRKLSDFKP
jgi:Flp pilus assembly protein TadB